MTTNERKIMIVDAMVCNGYHLMGETVEQFANRYSEEMLRQFAANFSKYIMNK